MVNSNNKTKHRKALPKMFSILAVMFVLLVVAQSFDETYKVSYHWYQNGVLQEWYAQRDVLAFQTADGKFPEVELDKNVVAYHFSRTQPDQLHVVYFTEKSTVQQRMEWSQKILKSENFYSIYPVITQSPDKKFDAGLWLATDNVIMIRFKFSDMSRQMVAELEEKYHMKLKNNDAVQFGKGIRYTYIFEWDIHSGIAKNALELAKLIYEKENFIVEQVMPNKIVSYLPVPHETLVSSDKTGDDGKQFFVSVLPSEQLKVSYRDYSPNVSKMFFIYDVMGQKIMTHKLPPYQSNFHFDISQLSAGIYFSYVETPDGKVEQFSKFRKL